MTESSGAEQLCLVCVLPQALKDRLFLSLSLAEGWDSCLERPGRRGWACLFTVAAQAQWGSGTRRRRPACPGSRARQRRVMAQPARGAPASLPQRWQSSCSDRWEAERKEG